MKKESKRKKNEKVNATSTSEVLQTRIKRKSTVTIGEQLKQSKDDKDGKEDKYDINMTIHSQKPLLQELLRKSKHLY